MAVFNTKNSGGLNSSPVGSPGGAVLDNAMKETMNNRSITRVGAWNVRGLLKAGKLHIVEQEAQANGLGVLGLSETHWKGVGHFNTRSGNCIYFSGNQTDSSNGVAFLLPKTTARAVLGYNPVSDRIITIKIKSNPFNINIVQVYAPTAEASKETLEMYYEQLDNTINQLPSGEILIVMGDMNAKIGRSTTIGEELNQIIGPFGLGARNERGNRMLLFCQEHNLTIATRYFNTTTDAYTHGNRQGIDIGTK